MILHILTVMALSLVTDNALSIQAKVPGTLIIAGGGKLPDAIPEAFIKAAGRKNAHIVVIPTASVRADQDDAEDYYLEPWKKYEVASLTLFHNRDGNKATVKPLSLATGVWFSGGVQARLIDAYHGTKVQAELQKLLQRGGVIGGSSAGAAVMSDLMIESGQGVAKTGPGFGFLPGVVIDQHSSQRKRQTRLRGVVAEHPHKVGIGIDESTAIIVQGRSIRVVGDNAVSLTWAKSDTKPIREQILKEGDRADLFQIRRAAIARAEVPSFPPKVMRKPEVPNGSLLIVGGGGSTPEMWKKFVELAGGKDALIVVVPTASGAKNPNDGGMARLLKRYGAKNVKVLYTDDRAEADDPEFSKALLVAGGVWFGGGRHWRFIDSYQGTLTEKRFHDVLKRGGIIGGSSAGATIQSEYMPRSHPLGNQFVIAEGYEKGFGFLPGCAVDQHFFARKRPKDMTMLLKQYPQLLGIGIDEATAILVQGHIAEVIGKSKVAFYDSPKVQDVVDYTIVKDGEKYDLLIRIIVKP